MRGDSVATEKYTGKLVCHYQFRIGSMLDLWLGIYLGENRKCVKHNNVHLRPFVLNKTIVSTIVYFHYHSVRSNCKLFNFEDILICMIPIRTKSYVIVTVVTKLLGYLWLPQIWSFYLRSGVLIFTLYLSGTFSNLLGKFFT